MADNAASLLEQAAMALAESDDLLRRLSEWDALNVSPYEGDRDYWLGQIENTRTVNRIALQAVKDA